MSLSRCTPWLLSLAGLVVACSDDPVTPPPTGSNKDASVTVNDDAAMTQGNPDAAEMSNVDAGPSGPCLPITGGNCNMGEICYYTQNTDSNVCRIPMGMPLGGNEAMCALGTMDCEAGFHCFNAAAFPSAVCLHACATNTDCDGLMGSGTNGYFCAEFTAVSRPKFCLPRPAGCDPLDQTTCPMGQYCETTAGGNGCAPEGTVATGGACQPGQCMRGNVCVNAKCQEPCNAMTQDCSGPVDRCISYQGIDFGLCGVACDVFSPMCGANEICLAPYPTNGAVCVPTQGTPSGPGGPCGGAAVCQSGLACVNGACQTPCDMAHPCAMGTCQMTNPPLAWGGVCI